MGANTYVIIFCGDAFLAQAEVARVVEVRVVVGADVDSNGEGPARREARACNV